MSREFDLEVAADGWLAQGTAGGIRLAIATLIQRGIVFGDTGTEALEVLKAHALQLDAKAAATHDARARVYEPAGARLARRLVATVKSARHTWENF